LIDNYYLGCKGTNFFPFRQIFPFLFYDSPQKTIPRATTSTSKLTEPPENSKKYVDTQSCKNGIAIDAQLCRNSARTIAQFALNCKSIRTEL